MCDTVPTTTEARGSVVSPSNTCKFYMIRLNTADTVPNVPDLLEDICEQYALQKEQAGQEHWQIVINLITKKRRDTMRRWLQKNLALTDKKLNFPRGAYCEPVKSWVSSVNYCLKNDNTVIEGTRIEFNLTKEDKQKWDKSMIEFPPLYDWQQKVVDIVKQPADDRKIIHVKEKYCAGKSLLGLYLVCKHNAIAVDGEEQHILSIIKGCSNTVKIVVIDQSADQKRVCWSAVEKIKNRYFASHFGTKGTGMVVLRHKCHVVVFSNNRLEDDIKKSKIDKNRFISIFDNDDSSDSDIDPDDIVRRINFVVN